MNSKADLVATKTVQLRQAIHQLHRADEKELVLHLSQLARFDSDAQLDIVERAQPLVAKVRALSNKSSGIDALLATYDLSSREGVVLMCLAEALLRIPDVQTVDRLIKDKIGSTEWAQRLGDSHSLFVNATTWGLVLTGRILNLANEDKQLEAPNSTLKNLITRIGEPVIRQAVLTSMRILGRQFVMGRTVEDALQRAKKNEKLGYRYTYDMLGEAARTSNDALRYYESYMAAIESIGCAAKDMLPENAPSISIKLSALHPRYEYSQRGRVMSELLPTVKKLALLARHYNISFTIDAEESDRLELSLDIIEALALNPELAGWNGLGLAVQAYQKRALAVIDWLADLAHRAKRRIQVRLVKGAYWDSEIKLAQERGLLAYPVFTRKESTDISYLACAKRLFADLQAFYPAFATHNAHSLSAVAQLASAVNAPRRSWEYQRLHGMGEELYHQIIQSDAWNIACRVYAPVGSHEDLLAYLVRRLLENGANSSFVNRIADADLPLEDLLIDPVEKITSFAANKISITHPLIPLPGDLYRAATDCRPNSEGLDMFDQTTLDSIAAAIAASRNLHFSAPAIIGGVERAGVKRLIYSPSDQQEIVGSAEDCSLAEVNDAMECSAQAFTSWQHTLANERAAMLNRTAALMQERISQLAALIVREGGRTQMDAVSEVREAIDFCYYYAKEAGLRFAAPIDLPGPTGEKNTLQLHGRGTFVCISPWNFPLAIFVGQITAALAAGNTVVAKPAEQTPLTAAAAIRIFHEAGIPGEVLNFVTGAGAIGAALVAHEHCRGVAFTGSTEVARLIAQSLASKAGGLVPLIAETGGQNTLIADSSALPEQLVRDVIASSFNSAGQRCSALRVLCVQEDIADKVLEMISGAMQELIIGHSANISTDIGPVIDQAAKELLEAHRQTLDSQAREIYTCKLPENLPPGHYFAPCMYEIDHISQLKGEVFGPVLHVVRWRANELDLLCKDIAGTGYGLTMGIHSRIDDTIAYICQRMSVGNIYVNRNMIGAVVGVQPFGGEGLSGTGPKAGGPHYLLRFASERTISVDTTAAGGNASLMSLYEKVQ